MELVSVALTISSVYGMSANVYRDTIELERKSSYRISKPIKNPYIRQLNVQKSAIGKCFSNVELDTLANELTIVSTCYLLKDESIPEAQERVYKTTLELLNKTLSCCSQISTLMESKYKTIRKNMFTSVVHTKGYRRGMETGFITESEAKILTDRPLSDFISIPPEELGDTFSLDNLYPFTTVCGCKVLIPKGVIFTTVDKVRDEVIPWL